MASLMYLTSSAPFFLPFDVLLFKSNAGAIVVQFGGINFFTDGGGLSEFALSFNFFFFGVPDEFLSERLFFYPSLGGRKHIESQLLKNILIEANESPIVCGNH